MKVVLFSDLHLDTSFSWLNPVAARRRRQALRETLGRIVELTIQEEADVLLCGGDLYEQERFTPDTGEFLKRTFERLYPMPVFLAPGNHDWWGPESLYRRVSWSPNVHVFTEPRLRPIEVANGLTLWGGAHQAPANTDNFLSRFGVDRSGVNIALFHGSERAWFVEQGEDKQAYAPFDAAELDRSGLDHAFLGHFHKPKNAERFTYPGNPDPLSFGEEGQRGALVATVESDGSMIRAVRSVATTSIYEIRVDLTGCGSQQDVRDAIAGQLRGLSGFARVTLHGELGRELDLPPGDLDTVAPHMDGVQVRIGETTVAYDMDALSRERTVRGQFVRDVLGSDLPADQRRRVLMTGLRALDQTGDLEVP
jgi:exonuclease SbcD